MGENTWPTEGAGKCEQFENSPDQPYSARKLKETASAQCLQLEGGREGRMRTEGPVLGRCHGEPWGRGRVEALHLLCLVQRLVSRLVSGILCVLSRPACLVSVSQETARSYGLGAV